MLINQHRQQARTMVDEDIGRSTVARILHCHTSIRLQKHACQQIQAFLNAIGHHDPLSRRSNASRCSHMQRNRFAQRQQALWITILAETVRILTQHALQQGLP